MSEETAEYKKEEIERELKEFDFNKKLKIELSELGKKEYSNKVYELTGEFAPAQVDKEGFTEISVLNFMLILGNIVNKKGIFKSQPLEID